MTFRRVSWAAIERGIDALARAIRAARLRPDALVGVLRGGLVPARLLADALDVAELFTIRARAYDGTRPLGSVEVGPARLPLAGKQVLLVDDICDSGATLRGTLRRLRRRGPRGLATAALYWRRGAEPGPDFHAARVPPGVWVVFPWERHERRTDRPGG